MTEKKKTRLSVGSEVLQSIFENGNSPLSQQFLRWKLWKKWSDFVGPTLGEVCAPVGYRKGVLYVWVKHSTWMQQIVFGLNPMRDQINARLGFNYIKAIHLTLDRRYVPGSEEEVQKLKENISSLMSESEGDF